MAFLSDAHQPEVEFCILGQWFGSNNQANRLYKRKDTQQYKFVRVKERMLRQIKRGKASLPVDVCRSKTSFLKLPDAYL